MNSAGKVRIALVTAPREAADALARSLVEDRIAACVNVVTGVTSVYRWEGEVETASEALLIAKCPADGSAEVPRLVAERHPYDVPEVLLLDVTDGLPAYLDWVLDEADRADAGDVETDSP